MARHAARDRVDGIFDSTPCCLQHVGHFAQRVLGLRHRHAVARHDDDLSAFFIMKAASSADPLDGVDLVAPPRRGLAPKPPQMTLMNERFIALHMM